MKEYDIEEGEITVACDGLSALRKAQGLHLTEPIEAHYDLISAICKLKQSLPIHVSFQHMKGHQDTGQMMVLLCLAWMNIEMDACTKQKVLEDNPLGSFYTIPHEGWVCSIDGKRVIKHLQTALWTHLNGTKIL